TEICSDNRFLVPAELAFFPYHPAFGEERCFSSNSNGLCSGNTVLEATVHGLAEIIERDILSFKMVDDRSVLVNQQTLPEEIRRIAARLDSLGLELHIRYVENAFALPLFIATVAEPWSRDPIYVNGGFGCNPSSRIALTRAVCEAMQSRLSFIHGGRDDLLD